MTEHSALPLGYFKRFDVGFFKSECWAITGKDHDHQKRWDIIADGIDNEDFARFIVTACNNYERVLAENEQLRKHGDFTNYEGRCQQFLRCRICKGRWEWEIEPPKHEENCPAIRKADES